MKSGLLVWSACQHRSIRSVTPMGARAAIAGSGGRRSPPSANSPFTSIPLSICQRRIAKLYTSTFSLYGLRKATSGAMYARVPVLPVILYAVPEVRFFLTQTARPKSKSFNFLSVVKPIFCGFKSGIDE